MYLKKKVKGLEQMGRWVFRNIQVKLGILYLVLQITEYANRNYWVSMWSLADL